MGTVYTIGQIAHVIKVSGKIMNFMVKVSMYGQMGENTTVIGRTTWWMEPVKWCMKMEEFMRASIIMIKKMVLVPTPGPMVKSIKVDG